MGIPATTIGFTKIFPTGTTTGVSAPVKCNGNLTTLVFYILGVNTISAGTLTVEECYADPTASFGGTWSTIPNTTVDLTTLSGGGATGKQIGVHVTGTFDSVRLHVTVDVAGSGGAIAAWMAGAH